MVVTRFPPSPTGDLHIGGVRTALYNWLLARQHGDEGKFVLRIEDTDLTRSKQSSVEGILEGMNWLGLNYDEGPIYQTDRFDRYREVIETMLQEGLAYRCYCSKERLEKLREEQLAAKEKPKYDGCCRDNPEGEKAGVQPVIRFKNPLDGEVTWDDMVHGPISFANQELDDFIIARPDGSPTYNFCVVVDDIDMNMTHVVRGDDHINNTPRQINIFRALGADLPKFGHIPMILGDDGKRLSKRHGAAGVLAYREAGYLPEAVLNYLVRLGWSHGDQEIFSIDEMTQSFDMANVNKSASAFNTDKLNWLNQHYLKEAVPERLASLLMPYYEALSLEADINKVMQLIPYYVERAKTVKEMAAQSTWVFKTPTTYPEKSAKKAFHSEAKNYLSIIKGKLEALPEDAWSLTSLHALLESTVSELDIGFGKIGMPLRLVLTGGSPSPNLDEILHLLGKEKSLTAIQVGIDSI